MSSNRQAHYLFSFVGVLVLVFVLAACGTGAGSGSGSSNPTSPSPTAATSQTGCPSSTVMTTPLSPANVVLKPANNNTTITAQVGNVIEVDLPYGQAWSGPSVSQGSLSLEQPAGFAFSPAKVCVWRFTAQSVGTAQLEFYGKAICKSGQACPQYIMRLPFTISVK